MVPFGKELVKAECGVGPCKPTCMKRFVSVNWFCGIYSITGLLTASLSMYIISQVTTIEKQFGLSSSKTGYLLACNDIGYCAFILVASYFANRVHIPRWLCCSTILYGVSGIICSLPHFLFKPSPLAMKADGSMLMESFAGLKLCTNTTHILPLQDNGNMTMSDAHGSSDEDDLATDVTMTLLAIGMIMQGVGKAPRYPMLGQFLDDNTNARETGFYLGIITSVAIFGPAIAYGLGGVFSQIYVTLEDVDLHPHDPRWLGAWWLGFLAFGIGSVLCALPLLLFPSSLRSMPIAKSRTPQEIKEPNVNLRSACREFTGVFRSIFKVLSVPAFTLMLLACICNVLGISAGFSFGPKYMEKQYNIAAWQANIIMAGFVIISLCVGSFVGGLLTKKLKLNPLKCTLLILLVQLPSLALQMIAMFLSCDQPQIHNWQDQSSPVLPSPCANDCFCDNTFLPVCDSDGTNYFSPCYAGCSQGSLMKFTNCSCVPTGELTTGLCQFDCDMLWPFMTVSFIGSFLSACGMMPTFIFNIRIVPNELKSMAIGLSALSMSLLAWLPGPVIGGHLVDNACLLWSGGVSGSCVFYDIDTLRYNIFGIGITGKCASIIVMTVIAYVTWNLREWPNMGDKTDVDFIVESKRKMKPDALLDANSYAPKQ